MPKPSPKSVPVLATDAEAEAEAFLDQDLSALDFSQFRPLHWASHDRNRPPPDPVP